MEEEEFSPENLKAHNQGGPLLPSGVNVDPRHGSRQTGPFLRGPVPMSWIAKAYEVAGGSGLMLGLSLWWVSGMTKSRTFSVNIRRLEVGQSLRCKWRALKALEDAGLIRRTPEPGKRLRVELLNPELTTQRPQDKRGISRPKKIAKAETRT